MGQKWEGFRKPNFGAPPSGYVAGIGRGATGFVTRSDLGPAKLEAAVQRENDDADYVDSKYDAWSGYSGALFSKKPMNEEDREAEEVYNSIEDRMDGKRRVERQIKQKEMAKADLEKKTIGEGFSDLKREMANISYDDWMNLPESVDSSLKKKKKEKFVAVPDAMLLGFMNEGETVNKQVSVDNINDLKEAKEILLKSQLDKASDKYKNQTAVDKTGYLTSLNGLKVNEESYIGDLKRARLVLKSATNTTPNNPEVWMCAARVQELDGKLYEARAIINQGLEHCKTSEDLWIEASRLQKPELAKAVLIKGLSFLPLSQKLWLTSARKEHQKEIKSRILKKGLESNSCSLNLWKQLIELADADEAKELLKKAVECLPKEVDLWLALAKLQKYEFAKSVLNKARKHNPLQFKIWIAAAELEETETDAAVDITSKIETILVKANQVLSKNGIIVKRDDWLEEAILCEKKGNTATCEAIVKLTYTLLSQSDLENIVYSKCLELQEFKQCAQTIRFLFQYGARTLNSRMLMEKFIAYERLKGSPQDLRRSLDLSLKLFSHLQQFWLISAENKIKNRQLTEALDQLDLGLSTLPNSQKILLLKVDIYIQNKEPGKAQKLLQEMRLKPRIESWIRSIQYYYRLKNYQMAWQLSEKACKIEMSQRIVSIIFRIQKSLKGYGSARDFIQKVVERFDKSLGLWMKFAELEIDNGFFPKARAILEKAMIKLPKSEELYALSINLEIKTGNQNAAMFILSKGLYELPKSGVLWAIAVELEPRRTKIKKIEEAQAVCSDNPELYVAAAKIFWRDNKIQKAKKWLQRAIIVNPSNGDSWAYFYCFMNQFQPGSIEMVLEKFKSNVINDGHRWKSLLSKLQSSEGVSNQQVLRMIVGDVKQEMNRIQ